MDECVSHAQAGETLVNVAAKIEARTFSNGQPVDSVETEKSRIVLKELEHGWWILAVGRPSFSDHTDYSNTASSPSI